MDFALRHTPIVVDGITSVQMFQRHYPGKIEIWIRIKEQSYAIRHGLPLRFMFDDYSIEQFSLTKIKHLLLNQFGENASPINETPKDRTNSSTKNTGSFSSKKAASTSPPDLTSESYSGRLINFGLEERELEGRAFKQYQCRIEDDSRDGNITQIWGEDIRRAIKDGRVSIGDSVAIEEIRIKGERKKSFNFN